MGDDLVAVIANQFISMPIWVMVGSTAAPLSFLVTVLCGAGAREPSQLRELLTGCPCYLTTKRSLDLLC